MKGRDVLDDTREDAGAVVLAPLVIFVAMFTACPAHPDGLDVVSHWSIIEPAKWVGVANFVKAWNDRQFWVSLGFTLKYPSTSHRS